MTTKAVGLILFSIVILTFSTEILAKGDALISTDKLLTVRAMCVGQEKSALLKNHALFRFHRVSPLFWTLKAMPAAAMSWLSVAA